jgi:hypothetical protein
MVVPHRTRQNRLANTQLFPEVAPILASIAVHLIWMNVHPEKHQCGQHEPSTVGTIGADSTENGLVIGEVFVFYSWWERRFMHRWG